MSKRGQALVELAVVMPIILVLAGGIIQFGAVIATKHALIQIGRDVGRWAATQPADPCTSLYAAGQPAQRANEIALESHLMGYADGTWPAHSTSYGIGAIPATPPTSPGIEVAWEAADPADCPPEDSTKVTFVTIRLAHEAPVLLPGFDLVFASLPGLGTCDSSGRCSLLITTTAQFRMEPEAQAPVTSP